MGKIDFGRTVSAAARQDGALDRQDAEEREAALAYLRETDWMVVRKMEVNTSVPAEVTQKRAQARARLSVPARPGAGQ